MKKSLMYIIVGSFLILSACSNNNGDIKPIDTQKPTDVIQEKEPPVIKELNFDEVVNKTKESMSKVSSYNMNASINSGQQIMINGTFILNDNNVKADMKTTIDNKTLRQIVDDEWIYMNDISNPNSWVKSKMNKSINTNQNIDINVLSEVGGTKEIKEENNSYILNIQSDEQEKLMNFFKKQSEANGELAENQELYSNITFDKADFTYIIDNKDYTVSQIKISLPITIKNNKQEERIDASFDISFNNYNQATSISIPEEALQAEDISQYIK